MTAAIVTEARARLAALWPGWRDMSGDPYPVASAALPAFGVRLSHGGATRSAMGSAQLEIEGALVVAIWTKPATADPEEEGHGFAAAIRAAILAAPDDLGGAVWDILPDATEVDHDKTDARTLKVEQTFTLTVLE